MAATAVGGNGQPDKTEVHGSAIRGSRPERPYCWASKPALRRIRDHLDDQEESLAHALALYLVLVETASDRGSSTFQVRIRELAARAGISTRQAKRVLPVLREIRLVSWRQNRSPTSASLEANTYSLLACQENKGDGEPSAEETLASDSDALPSARNENGAPGTVQRKNYQKEQKRNNPSGGGSSKTQGLSGAELITRRTELERVEARIKEIRDQAPEDAWGRMYSEHEKGELRALKDRREALKSLLGFAA